MKHKPTSTDMKAAAQLLQALAAPIEEPVYLQIGRSGGEVTICLQPALARTLREMCCYIAAGESVTIMSYGPQPGKEEDHEV